MTRRLSQRELLALRKEMLKLKLEVQRQELLYNSQPIRRPLATLSQFGRSKLTQPRTLATLSAAVLLLGAVAPRLGKIGRWLRVGISLYPIYQAFSSTAQAQTTSSDETEQQR